MELLQHITYPDDLRKLTEDQLPQLCQELREDIVKELSVNPGHLASSLGVVELTVALHYVYDTPKDRIVWDVGHQAYGHKILTGRRSLFSTNRKLGGLKPFPSPEESEYDTFMCGHASNSISAALGMAVADKGQQRVTAGNASGINDGAAAIVLASGEAVKKYGLKPMAKLIGWGQGGVDPKIMGVGPVVATRQAMKKAGCEVKDMDLIEANEAFAAQSIAVARELGFDMSKVNVNGGAISIGHPVGASGARIIVTLLHEMQKRPEAKKGLATLCIGGGQGVATVFEKV